MRKITPIVSALALALTGSVFAQTSKGKIHKHETSVTERSCGTIDHHEFLKQTRPGYEKDFNEYNKIIDAYIKKQEASTAKTAVNITIPVVVHIVYGNATENISDARAISQVDVLNEDFQKQNADTTIIPAIFKPVAGGVNVTFCLAQRDPSGNPTTGIVHKSTTVATFSTDDAVKSTADGGDDAWDVTKYVNIWVCDLGTSLLGYGEFPTGSLSNTYGLVLNYRYTGRNGGAQAPFNLGRTGTHEFGHCFNLRHIWGDDGTACTGSDLCADTPNQKGENYGTPAFPQGTGATGGCCTAGDQSSMFMNYMDYTDDAGMAMFSVNQCTRIMAVLNNAPWNVLQSSDGCVPVNLVTNDASVFNVTSPTGTSCSSSFAPVITLKNMGSDPMTSCTITYQVDGGASNVYNWSGNLASLATASVTLPTISTTAGTHTLTVTSSNPNGTADGNATNDVGTTTFTILAGAGSALPFVEGFESTTFVPTGWTLYNPDAADTWVRTTAAFKSGIASARIDNYNNDFTGQRDEMITPMIDLTSASSPQLSFQVAYRLYTNPTANPNYSDTLEVLISTDCGSTYSSIYKKFGAALTTTTPNYNTAAFTPTSTQWRMETVSLASYSTIPNAMFKFRNSSQYENFLYLDDINIAGIVGIKDKDAVNLSVNVYPNPTNGLLNIEVVNPMGSASEISVYNVIGEKVLNTFSVKGNYATQTVDMSALANGVYQLEVKADGKSSFKKVVVNK